MAPSKNDVYNQMSDYELQNLFFDMLFKGHILWTSSWIEQQMQWTCKSCEIKLVYEGKIITIPIYVNGGET
jgi:hypothetical protein